MPKDSTLDDLDALYNSARKVRRRYDPDAFLNVAFVQGRQWTSWDSNRVFDLPKDPTREYVTDNRITPAVRTEIAKMTKTQPTWVGVPKTQSDDDVASARYAEMALEDAWRRHILRRKLRRALLWSRVAGAGYWKTTWDPTVGKKQDILVYADGHPQAGKAARDKHGAPVHPSLLEQLPPEMAAGLEPRTVAMGDASVEVKTFFELFVDPFADEDGLETAMWLVDEGIYSQDHVAKHFPEFVDKVRPDTDPQAAMVDARLPGWGTVDAGGGDSTRGVKLREYWSLDRHVVWAPGSELLLLEEKNPYPWLPYVMFGGIPVPGRFYPDGIVTYLRPRQVDLNKRLSQIAENADRIANPPLLVPSSMADDWEWEGVPGERIDYPDNGSATAMPSFLDVPAMQPYVENDIDRSINSMMEISGQHEVTGAQVPAGVTAASAINLLQEADDTRLGPDVGEMEQSLVDAGNRLLWIFHNCYSDERHLQVAGEDGWWDIEAFKGSMLDGCDFVEVQAGSGMPQSKAAQQAAISQVLNLMVQNGVPVTQRNLRRVLREYQVGGLEAFFADQARDETQVQDENRRLSRGEQLEINSYDSDEYHVEGHTDFMKTARYARLGETPKKNFEAHLAAHRDRISEMNPPAPDAPEGPNPPPPGANGAGPSTSPLASVPSPPGIPTS